MKVLISGHHINLGESLTSHIDLKIKEVTTKYFENPVTASIKVTKEKSHIIATEILINEGTGSRVIIKSSANDDDAYRSFDAALAKVEMQLKKHKNRIKNHHKSKDARAAAVEAKKYILSSAAYESDAEDEHGAPAIIAEKQADIETLSIGDAVMKMDLEDLSTLVFINKGSKKVNVVYYRKDGNISWVEVPNIG